MTIPRVLASSSAIPLMTSAGSHDLPRKMILIELLGRDDGGTRSQARSLSGDSRAFEGEELVYVGLDLGGCDWLRGGTGRESVGL